MKQLVLTQHLKNKLKPKIIWITEKELLNFLNMKECKEAQLWHIMSKIRLMKASVTPFRSTKLFKWVKKDLKNKKERPITWMIAIA